MYDPTASDYQQTYRRTPVSCLDFTFFPVTQVFFMQGVSLFLALPTDPRFFRLNETTQIILIFPTWNDRLPPTVPPRLVATSRFPRAGLRNTPRDAMRPLRLNYKKDDQGPGSLRHSSKSGRIGKRKKKKEKKGREGNPEKRKI